MKRRFAARSFLLMGLAAACGMAQEVISLPITSASSAGAAAAPGTYPEKQYYSDTWKTEVVTNVTKPSLTVYKPASGTGNGVAAVICPGGGFMALSITSEGIDVAKWLTAKGFTAFVLKYRLAHSGEDATREFQDMWQDKAKLQAVLTPAIPNAIADGLTAMTYVRGHAAEYGVSPEKVGIIGFSAGGTVTAAVALRYSAASRPAFAAPIYAAASAMKDVPVPPDAPPMFLAAATNDNLGLGPDSVLLYQKWTTAQKSAELHMYALGGHGFGMRKQNLPSDEWIDRFWDWIDKEQDILKK